MACSGASHDRPCRMLGIHLNARLVRNSIFLFTVPMFTNKVISIKLGKSENVP